LIPNRTVSQLDGNGLDGGSGSQEPAETLP
jgi:hypothetical protein